MDADGATARITTCSDTWSTRRRREELRPQSWRRFVSRRAFVSIEPPALESLENLSSVQRQQCCTRSLRCEQLEIFCLLERLSLTIVQRSRQEEHLRVSTRLPLGCSSGARLQAAPCMTMPRVNHGRAKGTISWSPARVCTFAYMHQRRTMRRLRTCETAGARYRCGRRCRGQRRRIPG